MPLVNALITFQSIYSSYLILTAFSKINQFCQ